MTEAVARTLAVDLGGTRMRAAVVVPNGDITLKRVMATPRDAPNLPPHWPDALTERLLAGNDAGLAGAAAWRRATRGAGRG